MLKKNILIGMCVFFLGMSISAYAADTEVILEDDTPDSGFAVTNSSGETTVRAGGDGNVGIGTSSPTQKLDVAGKIKVGDSAATPTAGTIRWTGSDFEGYDGTQWVSLTSAGGGGGINGYEIQTASTTTNRVSVNCSAGKKVTGGGCYVNRSGPHIWRNAPSNNSQWTCGANTEASDGVLTVYAICVDVN